MKMKSPFVILAAALTVLAACSSAGPEPRVQRTDALDDAAWDASVWISVADAPVVTGRIGGSNELAADGQNWFVTAITPEKKVVSAKWMTAGLGVYELYVNERRIGAEVLMPVFTHYAKTK